MVITVNLTLSLTLWKRVRVSWKARFNSLEESEGLSTGKSVRTAGFGPSSFCFCNVSAEEVKHGVAEGGEAAVVVASVSEEESLGRLFGTSHLVSMSAVVDAGERRDTRTHRR